MCLFTCICPQINLLCLCALCLAGVCDPGELPGYLVAHPREGRPGQAPLLHPPDLHGKSRLLWGSLRTTGLDRFCHGIHQEVCVCNIITMIIYIFTQGISSSLFCSFSSKCTHVSVSVFSWFWGPVVTLQDCLAAFFARDELKGKHVGVNLLY